MGFLRISWYTWMALALALALIFSFLWPKAQANRQTSRMRFLLVRWGQALVWLLLAIYFFLRAIGMPGLSLVTNLPILVALVLYLIYNLSLIPPRRPPES